MKQARKSTPVDDRRRKWPTTVEVVIPFISKNGTPQKFTVYYLDYAILKVLQFINTSHERYVVKELVVNDEFRPVFAVDGLSEQLYRFRFPIRMEHGSVLSAVLQAPFTTVAASSCYPKLPHSAVLLTDHGNFTFNASKMMRPGVL